MPRFTAPKSIFIIAVPGIGDALLATPLVRTLKNSWPEAKLTMLVRKGSEGILVGNSDIDCVLTLPRRPNYWESLKFIAAHFRQYDLAISTSSSDRWFIISQMVGKLRVLLVPPSRLSSLWKNFGSGFRLVEDFSLNTVEQNLRLADCLGLPRCSEVCPPISLNSSESRLRKLPFALDSNDFVCIHIVPGFSYKRWTRDHWRVFVLGLVNRGLKVVVTSGPGIEEVCYTNSVIENISPQVFSLAGQLSLAEVYHLVNKSLLFVGPDTSTTHLAAASGRPVIALFGYTNHLKWAPWPAGYSGSENPFSGHFSDDPSDHSLVGSSNDCEKLTCRNIHIIKACCDCAQEDLNPLSQCGVVSQCMNQIDPSLVLHRVDEIIASLHQKVN